ncbi:hypothetical protein GCM10010294_27300 [Streptomyces griseoloalbus]|uniref:hypothetical protein n=1 Tax=Streptomyces griseoloalbus TaxID=67303 RepID=UPI00199DC7A1|nr:hypothetical protein GCM10010294_27300 [Streptomyces griseoloalbus]
MADRFEDGLLTPAETASHLEIPQSTLLSWLKSRAAGGALLPVVVEHVRAERGEVRLGQDEGLGDRVLERARGDVGQELLL